MHLCGLNRKLDGSEVRLAKGAVSIDTSVLCETHRRKSIHE